MASLVLPDSNFYITSARAGRDPFQELAAHAEAWEFATCGMVVLEVCRGRRIPDIYERFRERFAVMIYIPTTSQIWDQAAQLGWGLDRRGLVLPAPDLLIAACALQARAAVLTRDAHFSRVPGLEVIDRLA
ncbi:MAG: PIN domain-containing protein [Opitutales bacterium]